MLTLEGRTCAFGGATGQIGRGAVKMMIESGMNVVLMSHMLEDANALCEEMNALNKGKCIVIADQSMDKTFAQIKEQFGSLDVIIQSTGEFYRKRPLDELKEEELDRGLQRVKSLINVVNLALPYLKESKAPRIIFTTSASACNGFNEESLADAMARGAEKSMIMYLARELMPYGITVNGIDKSGMINDHAPKEDGYDAETMIPFIPMKRLGKSEEFGAAVLYLASEESAFTTGQIMHLSGGLAIGS